MHGRVGAGTIERVSGEMTRKVGRLECWKVVALATALSNLPTFQLSAQDTTSTRATSRIILPADTMHRGVRPMGAFLRSFILPGWGQAATDRPMTGAAFVAWEGITAMMTFKAQKEANYLKAITSKNHQLQRQEVQDWLVHWVLHHLFFRARAYLSAP